MKKAFGILQYTYKTCARFESFLMDDTISDHDRRVWHHWDMEIDSINVHVQLSASYKRILIAH